MRSSKILLFLQGEFGFPGRQGNAGDDGLQVWSLHVVVEGMLSKYLNSTGEAVNIYLTIKQLYLRTKKIMLSYVSFSRQSDCFLSGLNIDELKREETTTLLWLRFWKSLTALVLLNFQLTSHRLVLLRCGITERFPSRDKQPCWFFETLFWTAAMFA